MPPQTLNVNPLTQTDEDRKLIQVKVANDKLAAERRLAWHAAVAREKETTKRVRAAKAAARAAYAAERGQLQARHLLELTTLAERYQGALCDIELTGGYMPENVTK